MVYFRIGKPQKGISMNELIKAIIAAGFCNFSPINGVVYFIDAEDPKQVAIGEDAEDGRGYESFPSVEAALKGFMIDGKAIADYRPTVTKAKPVEPIKLVD